jgi:hypothetical protein
MLTMAAHVAAQVADPVEVELDEHGRGCAVKTDIGRVKLGTMCTIMWEYDEYGESLTDFWWPFRGPLKRIYQASSLADDEANRSNPALFECSPAR